MRPGKIVTDERAEDNKFDKMFTDGFLCSQVYPDMIKHGLLDSYEKVEEDADPQFEGIDAAWHIGDETVYVDYKTRISVTNKESVALTFELLFTDLTSEQTPQRIGWLLNKKLKTDYLLFSHITKAGDGTIGRDDITPENIDEVEFHLVRKSDVLGYITENICSTEELYRYAKECEKKFFLVNNTRKKRNIPLINVRFGDGPFKKYERVYKDKEGRRKSYCDICLITSTKPETPTNIAFQEVDVNKFPGTRNFFWRRGEGITEVKTK